MRKRLHAAGAGRKSLALGCNCPSSSQEETAVTLASCSFLCLVGEVFSLVPSKALHQRFY